MLVEAFSSAATPAPLVFASSVAFGAGLAVAQGQGRLHSNSHRSVCRVCDRYLAERTGPRPSHTI